MSRSDSSASFKSASPGMSHLSEALPGPLTPHNRTRSGSGCAHLAPSPRRSLATRVFSKSTWSGPNAHRLLRWPLFIIFAATLAIEILIYTVIRSTVRLYEHIRQSKRVRRLNEALLSATSFREYERVALELDHVEKLQRWKEKKQSEFYDWDLLERRLGQLRRARVRGNIEGVLEVLRLCIHSDFAGIFNEQLYSCTYTGTKKLIEEIVEEMRRCLDYVRHSSTKRRSSDTTSDEAVSDLDHAICDFLLKANSSWGTTALCLSGGGMNGMHHFGVAEVLLELGLMPSIVCGASAGAVAAAFLCTRTDEELKVQMTPEYIQPRFQCMTPSSWFVRIYRLLILGYMFDSDHWNKVMSELTLGFTFEEAFQRTGKVLNIVVSRKSDHAPPMVLNHLNAPHVLISSAVIASSAMPFLVEAQILKEKDSVGRIKPHAAFATQFMCDGSVDSDIPRAALSEIWGLSYSITVQVNIHVFPWLAFRNRGSAGKPLGGAPGTQQQGRWRGGFVLSAFETLCKEHMRLCVRAMALLDIFPRFYGIDWGRVFLQDYQGGSNVLIMPRHLYLNHVTLISHDPTVEQVKWFWHEGKLMTWPKISMIRTRMLIERKMMELEASLRNSAYASRLFHGSNAIASPSRGRASRRMSRVSHPGQACDAQMMTKNDEDGEAVSSVGGEGSQSSRHKSLPSATGMEEAEQTSHKRHEAHTTLASRIALSHDSETVGSSALPAGEHTGASPYDQSSAASATPPREHDRETRGDSPSDGPADVSQTEEEAEIDESCSNNGLIDVPRSTGKRAVRKRKKRRKSGSGGVWD